MDNRRDRDSSRRWIVLVLALSDTYDTDWQVDVDGVPARMMRVNGLFRGVHLTPGEHTVTFSYRPAKFYLGAATSAITALGLALACAVGARRRGTATAADLTRREDG